jgi:uncharacterized protein involved in outer membrane biogenesis
MKKLGVLLVAAAALFLAFAVLKNSIAQSAVQGVVKKMTGLKLGMRSLDLQLRNTRILAKGIQLKNPAGFTDPVMVDMPTLDVDYELGSILKGAPHLETVELDLAQIVIIKNRDGKLNLDALKPAGGTKQTTEKPAQQTKAPQIRIDLLHLKIGKVVYKDYSNGGSPSVQEFDLRIDEQYRNITNINAIVPIIVSKALSNAVLGRLVNFDIKGLMSQMDLGGVNFGSMGLGSLSNLSSQAAQQAQGVLSGAQKMLQGAASGSGNASKDLTKAADEAVKGVSDLFGSLTKKS